MRIRLSTRKALILSGLVALAYGAYREIEDYREWSGLAFQETHLRGEAAFHVRQAAYCRGPASSTPYDKHTRQEAVTEGVGYSLNAVDSWSEEADLHDHWAWSRGWFADELRQARLDHQRRLLWLSLPTIPTTREDATRWKDSGPARK